MAEDALALSLDDIIKRNRDSSKQQPKSKARDEGGRRGRGTVRKNGGTARVAVVSTVQTKRTASRGRRGGASGTFRDYDGTLFEVNHLRALLHQKPPPSLPPPPPGAEGLFTSPFPLIAHVAGEACLSSYDCRGLALTV